MSIIDDRYIELAAGIVKQAMSDYKKALMQDDYRKIKSCERFFLSGWGQFLTANHGEYAIERCKKEVESEKEEEEQSDGRCKMD